ncbi:SigE family RNA polymerase sigma factor [Nocardia sp. NRRL S-836]|uniref:SigE family RNA polymerase sigma factor n=1 Tax=Nocardia sp. NRRL S-836 TaxID=1519492 RepID=UPI000AEAE86C|nr:SigE family RNA polymerase sigma factor [Nocardia sp. NRRL S-836]
MDRRDLRDREFGEFVDARALVMRRTAFLLCGDWHRAEDIVQTALIKLYVAWPRVRKDSLDAYARKIVVRAAVDETRRGFFQRERTVDVVPDRAAPEDQAADPDLRQALDALPPGQRAVVVLRYWEDLSVTETARILGRTEGTVKSQAAKGLAALRGLLVDEPASNIRRSEVIRAGRTKLARRRTAVATALVTVLVVGLGTVVHLARPQLASAPDSATSATSGRDAELTRVLRQANVLPAGVTPQDPPGATALRFVEKDGRHRASALLTDARGTGAVTVLLYRDPTAVVPDCLPVEGTDCRIEQVNGVKVRSGVARREDGAYAYDVRALRPDGTYVEIRSLNIGSFLADAPGVPDWNAPATRPEPVLDRAALIKIATLPGLTA